MATVPVDVVPANVKAVTCRDLTLSRAKAQQFSHAAQYREKNR
jgi:hypothetical protein